MLGQTEALLYRRGNFNGTWDDLICQALLQERDAEIALSPGLPLGHDAAGRLRHHARGSLQPDGHDLPGRLPHADDGRDAARDPRGRRRQPLQPRPLLPAGRRHGPRRRHGLRDRRRPADRQPHLGHDAARHRRAHRSGQGVRRRRLGLGQRRAPRGRRSGTSARRSSGAPVPCASPPTSRSR